MAQNFEAGYGNANELPQGYQDSAQGYGQQPGAEQQPAGGGEQELQGLVQQFMESQDPQIAIQVTMVLAGMMGLSQGGPPAPAGPQAPQPPRMM